MNSIFAARTLGSTLKRALGLATFTTGASIAASIALPEAYGLTDIYKPRAGLSSPDIIVIAQSLAFLGVCAASPFVMYRLASKHLFNMRSRFLYIPGTTNVRPAKTFKQFFSTFVPEASILVATGAVILPSAIFISQNVKHLLFLEYIKGRPESA